MSRQNVSRMLQVIAGILVLMTFNTNLSGAIWYNGSGFAFEEEELVLSYQPNGSQMLILYGIPLVKTVITTSLPGIQNTAANYLRDRINKSATNFLASYSHLLMFLKDVEASEAKNVDYNAFKLNLDETIEYMESTKKNYTEIVEMTKQLPYNKSVILKLENFRYDQFQESNNLRKDVFEKVKTFLIKGDVRGMYKKTLSQLDNILTISRDIRRKLKSSKSVLLSDLWRLNQLYSEAMFMGQYAAQVFEEVKQEVSIKL
ncbi:MAG: hypothetical protein JSV88_15290 [Candidatus Aminicenantes bacterium]|nr:MAG: hypothetical protein JSV88_15290 [Candidatus Aminicenantes bacterium]